MTNVEIQPGRPEHAQAVAALWTQMARQHTGFDAQRWEWAADAVAVARDRFAERTADPDAVALVAVDAGGRVVGFLQGTIDENRPARAVRLKGNVHTLVVDEPWRGRGVGERLMKAAIERFREKGAGELVLHCATANEGGRRFYERLGMRAVSHEMYCRL